MPNPSPKINDDSTYINILLHKANSINPVIIKNVLAIINLSGPFLSNTFPPNILDIATPVEYIMKNNPVSPIFISFVYNDINALITP